MKLVFINFNFINNYKGNIKELKDGMGINFNFINNCKGNLKEKLDDGMGS